MKKLLLLISITTMAFNAFSQTNTFPTSGNVGIGTLNPQVPLHISKDLGINPINHDLVKIYRIAEGGVQNAGISIGYHADGTSPDFSYVYFPGGQDGSIRLFNGSSYEAIHIKASNGNVGIGTSSPQSKLAVNGTITAQKVKVTQTGWPDYVFDSTYNVPPLSLIETYIKATHHLQDIPSAEEIESKGLDLGEMQKKQMQKIEEFMLYLIQQNKIIQKQQGEIDRLEKQVKLLKDKMDK